MIRVLQLIKGLGRGGAEKLLVDLVRYVDPDKIEFKVIYFLPHKNQLVPNINEKTQIELMSAGNPVSMVLKIPALVRKLKTSDTNIIHCHLPWSGIIARIAGKIARIPVVYTEHNVMERYNKLTYWANLLTFRLNTKVIAVSEEVKSSIIRNSGETIRVKVVHNGVDTSLFDPSISRGKVDIRSKFSIPANCILIGTVAVFTRKKRLDLWLEIAADILKEFPNVRFLMVGNGPERQNLELLSKELKLTPYIHFAGIQEDIKPWLLEMDIFLMTSEFEGLPVALLEAMSMEKAVSVTKVGGIVEVVNETNGIIADKNDKEMILENTKKLIRDKNLRDCLGKKARERIISDFSFSKMFSEIEEVYEGLINGTEES